jgi:hypothetical protein
MEGTDRRNRYLNSHERERRTVNDLVLNKYIDDYGINPELSKFIQYIPVY